MKKILYITYYWPPCGGPGVQRSLKFVKYLYSCGIEPIVITVDAQKASYPVIDSSLNAEVPSHTRVIRTSTFEPFSMYEMLTRKKEIPHSGFVNEGTPSFMQKASRFIRGNLFVPDPRKGWNRYVLKAVDQIIKNEKIEAVITSSPPHSTQLAGLAIKERYNIPWIADLRDPWTDIYYYKSLYHLGFVRKRDAGYERQVLQNADAVLVVSKDIKRIFASKLSIDGSKHIHVLPNGYDAEDFNKPLSAPRNTFVLAYTGTMAESYNIQALLEALKSIAKRNTKPEIIVRVAGKVSPGIISQIERAGLLPIFDFAGYIDHQAAIEFMTGASVLLLVIPEIVHNEGILTGKLFEYMAACRPIVGIGPIHGDAAEILNETGAGKMFDYKDFQGILNEISGLYESSMDGGVRHAKITEKVKAYSRYELTVRLAGIINNLTKPAE
jgi:glycosyltransferase involved in cell wall biosynthesis